MKYSIECSVDGKVAIGRQIKAKKGSKEYVLIPDNRGLLSTVKIVVKVEVPEKFRSRIEPGEGQVAAKITIGGDREQYQELIREFQELESVLSFSTKGCLRSINWDAPKREFVAETEEEKPLVGVLSVHFEREYPDQLVPLSEKEFDRIIQSKHHYESLVVPKAFYREGINEFHSFRYINAFYNFYFVLEDLYGQGKTKNKDITHAFRSSTEFREFLAWVMNEHIDKQENHRANIQRFCAEEQVTYDVDGLIELLQRVRGNLHHYSSRSTKHLGSPFHHEDFESIAFMTMGLALRAILQKILGVNRTVGIDDART